MRLRSILALAIALASPALAQTPADQQPATPEASTPTITSQSNLVVVPALVRDKKGQLVWTLKEDDFVLTDDGVPQKIHLEQDTGGEPLALVVDIEGGGDAARELAKFATVAPMLDAIVGGVPHKIAVVGYDSSPVLVTDFTPNVDAAAKGIMDLIKDDNGDDGAATLDSLIFSIDLLRKQPPNYRRAILLIAESRDRGSKARLVDALHAISDTNTAIYSIGFSSTTSDLKHESVKALGSSTPGPAHGCFSRDPNDPNVNLNKSAASQAYDCFGTLLPPLALARAIAIAVVDGFQRNTPETVAKLTGGEYFKLGSEKNFERDLQTISNHIPNRYILTFQPQSPHPGFHAITLDVPQYAGLKVSARNGYWIDESGSPPPHKQ